MDPAPLATDQKARYKEDGVKTDGGRLGEGGVCQSRPGGDADISWVANLPHYRKWALCSEPVQHGKAWFTHGKGSAMSNRRQSAHGKILPANSSLL